MLDIGGASYLDASEACELLGIKPSTLYAYVSRGRIRSFRQGIRRRRLYRLDEIEGLLSLQADESFWESEAEEDPLPPRAERWIGEI